MKHLSSDLLMYLFLYLRSGYKEPLQATIMKASKKRNLLEQEVKVELYNILSLFQGSIQNNTVSTRGLATF